jgi:transposase
MAYQEVSRVEIKEVIRQWQAGSSLRGMSRATGLSRGTVRKYILAAKQVGVEQDGPGPTEEQLSSLVQVSRAGPRKVEIPTEELLAPWAERVYKWLKTDRLQVTRIQELLAQRQCIVNYTSLRRFINRRNWGRRTQKTVRMAESAPGEVAEMDFGRLGLVWDPGGERRRVAWALLIVLSYSRHCFAWPLFHQKLVDIIEGLEAAWAFFGGLSRYLVIDNYPAAVAGADSLHPRLTRSFLEYAQHRGFIPDPTRVSHPKDKPRVERGISYVRERFFKGGQFMGLSDLRAQAKRWCLEVAGQRVHGTTRRLPLVVFQEEEQGALLPYNGEPYDVPDWRTAKVHPDHHIACQYALYSVPSTACPPGNKVEVRLDSKLLRIYHRGKLIKVHPRQGRGGRATDPDDYPAELSTYTLRAPDRVKRKAVELGPAVTAFADRLFEGPLPWAKLRQGQKLIRLGERYTAERLDAACQSALSVDLIDVRRLERILVEALEEDAAKPHPGSTPLPPGRFVRPGSAFAHTNGQIYPASQLPLLEGESHDHNQ